MLDKGAVDSNTAMHQAAQRDHFDLVKRLVVEKGADLGSLDENGHTLLHNLDWSPSTREFLNDEDMNRFYRELEEMRKWLEEQRTCTPSILDAT